MSAACAASQRENSTPTTLAALTACRSSEASSSSSRVDCSDQACRDRGFERVGRQLELPAVCALDDMSFSQQVLDGRDQKKRVAACQPVKRPRRLVCHPSPKLQIDEARNVREWQRDAD